MGTDLIHNWMGTIEKRDWMEINGMGYLGWYLVALKAGGLLMMGML